MAAVEPEVAPPPADKPGTDMADVTPVEPKPAPDAEIKTTMLAPEEEPAPPASVTADAPKDAAAPDVSVPADAAANKPATEMIAPSFDIVRVEPTGDAVIAGLAEPGSTVELMSGGDAVATAEANDRGEFAMALLEPLAPGPHDLAIRTTSADKATVMISDQRVAVMVPDSPNEEPLVVLNAPDAPSTVVQLPEAPPAKAETPKETVVAAAPAPEAKETVVASAPVEPEIPAVTPAPEATNRPVVAAAPETMDEAKPVAPGEPADETKVAEVAPVEPAGGKANADMTPEVAAAPLPEPETEVAAAPAPETTPEPAKAAPVEGPKPEVATTPSPVAEPAPTPETKPEEPSTEVAVAEPAPEPEPEATPAPAIVPEVVVTAVEAETTGALFVAGTATTPEPVRVYMDDKLLGEAKPSPSGTWLLEVKRDLPAGTYSVRADQVDAGTGDVMARAEVPFERDVEVAILKPVGEAGGSAGAEISGSVGGPQTLIIKRRDNLWRISRQLYGKGIRWSTIYQANKDQIRNPRWIYPGQVFVLPEGNAAWEETDKAGPPG